MFIRILCLLFICCAVALCASVEDQRKALQDLYEATNGNEWKNNTNWMRTEDYCSWYGVRCKTRSKNVNWIELDSNSLRGTIPSSISLLESLETLILSHNQLTGSIPESISQLKQFSSLNLNDNQMTGILPASIGQIPYLVVAYFGSNQLSGTIPESFGNLTIMYGLNLTDNQISGTVPSFFSQLTGLHMLKLGHNKLTGVDPNLNLSKGISCDLSDNPMSCPIPKWVFSQCSGQCVTATPPIQSPRAAGPVHEPVTHSPLVSNVKAPITTDASLDHTLLPLVIVLAVVVVVLIGVGIALVVRMKRREADPERKQLLGDEYIRIEE